MQRVLGMKLLTKTLKCYKITVRTGNTLPPIRHVVSEYSTCSYNPSHRAFYPFLANHFLPKPTLKYLTKETIFNGTTLAFARARQHVSKGITHSVDATRHSGSSGAAYMFQRLTVSGVIWGLIGTNAAVYLLWRLANSKFMLKNFVISVDNIRSGRLHTLITSAFSHHDFRHLIFNMVGLFFFGRHLGRVLGPEYLLKLYLNGALGGSVCFLAYHVFIAPSTEKVQTGMIDSSKVVGLGASGAVNAIMLLNIFLFPKQVIYVDFLIPVPAVFLGLYIVGTDLWKAMKGDSHVSSAGHLGGVAVAALAWYKIRRGRF